MSLVVVVSDIPGNTHLYEDALRALPGAAVTSYASPITLAQRAPELDVDVMVIDVFMKDAHELDFIERLRRRTVHSDFSVVLVTDPADNELRMQALRMGMDDILKRPADPHILTERVRRLLKLAVRHRKLADKAEDLEEEVRRSTHGIRQRELETIHRLTRAAQHRAKESRNHVVRMGHYAQLLAKAVGTDLHTQELIFLAAPMYDIGKVGVSDKILLKRGALTPPERESVKTHTTSGFEILRDSESKVIKMAGEIALSHHEKWDGTGYPKGLAREAIPIIGRICAVGDVFDALLATRPYKAAWPLPETLQTMRRGRGTHFDPILLDAFLDHMPQIQSIRAEFPDSEKAA
ncbi:MAG: HD-GYP domain-containing protein [Vulcanimicrobiaceae bacterium]